MNSDEILWKLVAKLEEAGYTGLTEGKQRLLNGFEPLSLALDEVVFIRPTPYLLVVYGDCDPDTMGPFETPEARDQKAREIRQKSDKDGVYGMDVVEPKAPSIWPYSNAFMEKDGG